MLRSTYNFTYKIDCNSQWMASSAMTDCPTDLYLAFYQSTGWSNVLNVQKEMKVTAGSVTNLPTPETNRHRMCLVQVKV